LPNARIYSFEPLPDVFHRLTSVARRSSNFEAVNVGISDVSGEADFEANALSQWSSLLTISPRGKNAVPRAARTTRTRVSLTTLDDWAGSRTLEDPLLVKVDVQGLEDRVIRGGIQTMTRAEVIIMEVSFVRVYNGQALFDDIYCQMRSMGFRCAGMIEISSDRKTGELLQGDAIFVPADAVDDDG
jgi:FkbM family methyltransferase